MDDNIQLIEIEDEYFTKDYDEIIREIPDEYKDDTNEEAERKYGII